MIRMLEDAIGKSKFIRGVRDYLLRHRFRNAVSRDLFESLQNSSRSGIDIIDFMIRWTNFPGFPLINVDRDGSVVRLSQRRFAVSKKFQQTLEYVQSLVFTCRETIVIVRNHNLRTETTRDI